jgi:Putative transposase
LVFPPDRQANLAEWLQSHNSRPHQRPKTFAAWLRPLFRSPWMVYSKRPFGGAQHALRYLGQYTHRVAISNHRLVTLANGMVTFRWRDSAHHNKKRLMTLPINEFLRRFLLHMLPPGFVRIRYFGWMAHRRRGASLPLCLRLLVQSGRVPAEARSDEEVVSKPRPLWTCPQCAGPMVLIERLSPIELRLRSPPVHVAHQP